MYRILELGLRIEFGPVRNDSVRRVGDGFGRNPFVFKPAERDIV